MDHPLTDTMEVIVDELQKNHINIGITILSGHIQYILNKHEGLYNNIVDRLNSEELQNVFNEMDVINVGRALVYLALVYRMNIPEENSVHEAVRLAVPVLKSERLKDDLCILTYISAGGAVQRIGGGEGYTLYSADFS